MGYYLFTISYHHPITWEVQLLAISFLYLLKKPGPSKIILANCSVQTQAGCAQEPSRSTKPQSLVHLPIGGDSESLDVQNTKDIQRLGNVSHGHLNSISVSICESTHRKFGVAVWRWIFDTRNYLLESEPPRDFLVLRKSSKKLRTSTHRQNHQPHQPYFQPLMVNPRFPRIPQWLAGRMDPVQWRTKVSAQPPPAAIQDNQWIIRIGHAHSKLPWLTDCTYQCISHHHSPSKRPNLKNRPSRWAKSAWGLPAALRSPQWAPGDQLKASDPNSSHWLAINIHKLDYNAIMLL